MLSYLSKVFSIIILMLIVLIGLDYMSATIDRNEIRENARESLRVLAQEGDYHNIFKPLSFLKQDNFTDAIMIGCTVAEREDMTHFENMCFSPTYYPVEPIPRTLGIYKAVLDPDDATVEVGDYARYWHGYQMTLRPLLKYMDLKKIRILNYFVLSAMAMTVLLLLNKKIGRKYAIVFLLSILFVGFPVVPLSLQFVTCFLICFIAMITMLLLPEKVITTKDNTLLFLIFGGITSFFDLLTTPLLTLGMPLIVMLLRRNRFPDYRCALLSCLMWFLGYASVWITKWILAGVFTPYDIISSVSGAIAERSGSVVTLSSGMVTAAFLSFLVLSIAAILFLVTSMRKRVNDSGNKYLSLVLIGLLPFLWAIVLQNHSVSHYWFVWRILAVSIFALGAYYVKVVNFNSLNRE